MYNTWKHIETSVFTKVHVYINNFNITHSAKNKTRKKCFYTYLYFLAKVSNFYNKNVINTLIILGTYIAYYIKLLEILMTQ